MRVDRSYDNINRSMVVGGSGAANDQNSRRSKPGNTSFTGGRNSNSQRRPPLPLKSNTLVENYQTEDKPSLGLALKLEVAKKPMNQRPHY